VLLDPALSLRLKWLARVAAPVAAVAISGRFLGLAYNPHLLWLLYFAAACLVVAVVLTGVGLLKQGTADGTAAGINSITVVRSGYYLTHSFGESWPDVGVP
jgi:hypothetical protein